MSKWINDSFASIKVINRFLQNFQDKKDFYININKLFKLYHENILNLFDSNCSQILKDSLVNTKLELNNFINYFEQNKLLTPYYSLYEENQYSSEFIENLNKFADENISSQISAVERTDCEHLFFYEISFFSNIKIKFDFNTNDIIGQINEAISENLESLIISEGNKKNYMNNAIRCNKFDLNIDNILNKIKDIGKLKSFIKDKIGIENFDYKGNSLNFNSSQNIKRGTEKYHPPYGWIGIGLKVIGKYNEDDWLKINNKSSKWAIAYHPISSLNLIKKILKEGLIPGEFQGKKNENDKRNYGKKVGIGNYLYQDIKVAEDKANIINLNGKRYKFIFMSRMKISEIREPEDINY